MFNRSATATRYTRLTSRESCPALPAPVVHLLALTLCAALISPHQPSRDRIGDITLATLSLLRTNHMLARYLSPCSLQGQRSAPLATATAGLPPCLSQRHPCRKRHIVFAETTGESMSMSMTRPASCKPNCKHVPAFSIDTSPLYA